MQVRLDPQGKGVTIAKTSWDQVREGAFITDILPKIKGQPLRIVLACHQSSSLRGMHRVLSILFSKRPDASPCNQLGVVNMGTRP